MLLKLLSLLFSVIMLLVPSVSALPVNIADTLSCMLFSVPFTSSAMESAFLDEMTADDAVIDSKGSGFISNHLVIILNDGVSFREKVDFFRTSGGFLLGWACPGNLYVLAFPAHYSLSEINGKCSGYMTDERVAYACPDIVGVTSADYIPDDPFETGSNKWNMKNPGGSNWWLEEIDAPCAWDYKDLFSDVTLGIVDSGVDISHEDFDCKVIFPNYFQYFRNFPSDHGSHVTGIVAAEMDNGIGIAGICSQAKLIEVDWSPNALQLWNTTLSIIFGIISCIRSGAKAVNISLGTTASMEEGTTESSDIDFIGRLMAYALAALINKNYDFLGVQSAGNGCNNQTPLDARLNGYFSSLANSKGPFLGVSLNELLDRTIIVGALGQDGDITSYSNYGERVTVCAPGDGVYSCATNNKYKNMSGTSMAAPMVTGAAGVVWSLVPSLSAKEVKNIIVSSTQGEAKYPNDESGEKGTVPILNVNLAAVNALTGTGRFGKVISETAEEDCSVRVAGRTYSSCDGNSFVFAAPVGEHTAELINKAGKVISTASLSVTKDSTVNLVFPVIE